MVPPSIRRAWWLGGAWLVLFLGLGAAYAVMTVRGAGVGVGSGSAWGVVLPSVPFVGMFGIYGAMWSIKRTLKRYRAAPGGLCVRCEYPLPEPAGGEEKDAAVTCSECGLVRTRQEHRRAWARWVGDLD